MSDNYLPSEIVLKILHRLPVKSLVKFTSVCRAWNSLITDRTFISDHLNLTLIQSSNGRKGSLFFQFFLERNLLRWRDPPREYAYSLYSTSNQQTDNHFSFERVPLPFLFFSLDRCAMFVGTCNGLVCSDYYSPSSGSINILIWNPLLRKYVVVSKPIMTLNKHVYTRRFGLGFDSRNNDYKVVVLMHFVSRQHTDYLEVYSLVSRSWRSITISVPKFFLETGCPPLFVNGAMHWVVCRKKDGSIQRSILSFDVTEETFGELTLPLQSNEESNTTTTLLVVEGGRWLAVVNHPRKGTGYLLHIWVMKEYGVTDSWTEILHCDARRYGGRLDVLALTSNGKGIMRCLDGAIVLVDPTKESMEPIGHQKVDAAYAGSYVESLVFINKEFDALSL
ncbi:hypothetical protein QN277_023503 [Acacia crassicarpa]|uniref:F-box domain-containing protein n=1 Tax=Acacia crassicarpa TaxID=499986 RepID=A0AAE1JJ10_9FABA|nr:hypothetical protein QN277_023503 [Acacia crassicarpa]